MADILTTGASLATANVILGIKDLKLSSELIGQLKCDVICCLLVAAEGLLRRPQNYPKFFALFFSQAASLQDHAKNVLREENPLRLTAFGATSLQGFQLFHIKKQGFNS